MVIESAVNHQERLAARNLAVNDSGDINSGFANKVASKLNDQAGFGEIRFCPMAELFQVVTDRCQIEFLFAGEVGNAKATAKVQEAYWRGGVA